MAAAFEEATAEVKELAMEDNKVEQVTMIEEKPDLQLVQ